MSEDDDMTGRKVLRHPSAGTLVFEDAKIQHLMAARAAGRRLRPVSEG